MDAVRAQDADQQRSDATDQPAGVVECVGHGQDARPERALQQVDQRFVVRRGMLDVPVLVRVVVRFEARLLVLDLQREAVGDVLRTMVGLFAARGEDERRQVCF